MAAVPHQPIVQAMIDEYKKLHYMQPDSSVMPIGCPRLNSDVLERFGPVSYTHLDIFLSGMALIVLSPLLLVTAILVRVKLGSPVIFCQERPGRDEKIFKLHKFRSMSDARDENGNQMCIRDRR